MTPRDLTMTTIPGTPDRLLLMHDVRARLPQLPNDGGCAYSTRWVREHVAPNTSRREGGRWVVRESDFEAWRARWVAGKLTEEELSTRLRTTRARKSGQGLRRAS